MNTWTQSNTEGFTDEQLSVINAAIEVMSPHVEGIDESNVDAAINNAWGGDETAEELAEKALSWLI